jgi:hypothetical protein
MSHDLRSNALWGRGKVIRTAALLALLAAGSALGVVMSGGPAARAADCPPPLPPSCLPTVSTPTLPVSTTLPISLPVTTTVTLPGGTPSTTTPGAQATTTTAATQTSASAEAALAYSLRTAVRRLGGKRWIDIRLTVSADATLLARLNRAQHRYANGRFDARQGANRFRLPIARQAKAGRYTLTVQLAAGDKQATVRRTVTVPKRPTVSG